MPYKPSLSVSRGLIPENNQNKGDEAMFIMGFVAGIITTYLIICITGEIV